ncbi:hypothetical protein EBQ24_06930 [Allofranklinella schreckenbergeri]|uniref:AbiEi antitoxin N-terminal domain-containing protein n=1 Tax=Allofranklinella schreckenbergeri TaxID=1076744 RepID=A0A3M6R2H5_9BURK|nr:hypothetical protein EBQ24_06930 [Allofranklinella schreckenbergeri]
METSHQTILDLAAQRGLIRPRDLDALGLPSVALTRLVRQGLLVRVGRGLYARPDRRVHAPLEVILAIGGRDHAVLDAFVFPHQHRACGWTVIAVAFFYLAGFDQGFDATLVAIQQVGIDLAELQLLQPVGNPAFEELTVVGGRVAADQLLPKHPDLCHRHLGQPGDLRRH